MTNPDKGRRTHARIAVSIGSHVSQSHVVLTFKFMKVFDLQSSHPWVRSKKNRVYMRIAMSAVMIARIGKVTASSIQSPVGP